MKDGTTSRREYWFVVAAGSALMLFTGVGAFWIKAHAERPQILLETASGMNALPLRRASGPDNAVAELLRSLPPDLALDVCANLAAGAGGPTPQPCIELRAIMAIAPAAPPSQPQSAMAASIPVVPAPSLDLEPAPEAVTAPDAPMTRTAAASATPEPLPSATPNEPAVASVQTAEGTEFDPATSSIEMAPLAPAAGPAAPSAAVENDTTEPRVSGNSAARATAAAAATKAAAEAKAKAKAKAAAEAEALAKAKKAKAAARNAANNGTASTGRGKNGGTSGEGGGD